MASSSKQFFSDTTRAVHEALETLRHAKVQHERAVSMLKRQQQHQASEQQRYIEDARRDVTGTMSHYNHDQDLIRSNYTELHPPKNYQYSTAQVAPKFVSVPDTAETLSMLHADVIQVNQSVEALEKIVLRQKSDVEDERDTQQQLQSDLRSIHKDKDSLLEKIEALIAGASNGAKLVEYELSLLNKDLDTCNEQNAYFRVQIAAHEAKEIQAKAAAQHQREEDERLQQEEQLQGWKAKRSSEQLRRLQNATPEGTPPSAAPVYNQSVNGPASVGAAATRYVVRSNH